MFTGPEIVNSLTSMGITHVVWLPDSVLGTWEAALETAPSCRLVRVCREGEAWAVAGGLMLGGARPLLLIQNTGLFESGDALRNVLFDLRLPLFAVIGYRSYLVENSPDTARRFTEPILRAWGIDYVLLDRPETLPRLAEHYQSCRAAGRPGAALVAEGRM
jgi:sulfopyruvate decarboxylase TPP-binding subunit